MVDDDCDVIQSGTSDHGIGQSVSTDTSANSVVSDIAMVTPTAVTETTSHAVTMETADAVTMETADGVVAPNVSKCETEASDIERYGTCHVVLVT